MLYLHDQIAAAAGAKSWDVAIVGAGIIGVFLATLLEKNGLRVALIEGAGVTPDTSANAAFTGIAGRSHSSTESGRAMGLGGTGLMWGGQLAELARDNIERPNAPWPFTYTELSTLYTRTYLALGMPPRHPDADMRSRMGDDEGKIAGVERIFSYWLPNPNLAYVNGAVLSKSASLDVFLSSKATGFVFDTNGRALAVQLKGPQGEFVLHADRFVLAAGVVESCRLALAAQRQRHCPWHDNPMIGRAFQDHVGGELGALGLVDARRFRDKFETGFINNMKYMPKLRYSSCAVGGGMSVCAFPIFRSSISEHIANIKQVVRAVRSGTAFSNFAQLPASVLKVGKAFAPLVYRYATERRVLALMDQGVRLGFQCEQMVLHESQIRLGDGEVEPDGLPRVALDWRVDGKEGAFLQEAADRFAAYFQETGMARLTIEDELCNQPSAFIDGLRDTSHPAGGLCMGSNASNSATDKNAKLWGAHNVFAAGASLVPTSGDANITLTGLALALRLCDHLTDTDRGERA